MPSLSMSIKSDVIFRLDEVAKKLGSSKSKICESAITQYLDELEEDEKDLAIAQQISCEIEEGRMKTFSAEEVYKELGI